MSRRYRLLAIDIDGTLINRYGDVSPENREALARVRRAGIKVSVSTGRSVSSSLEVIRQAGLENYHIFFDGALSCRPETGEEIYVQTIAPSMVTRMIEYARRHNTDLELYSASEFFSARETWSTEAHRNFFGVEPVIIDFDELPGKKRIVKGGLVVTNQEEMAAAEDFMACFADDLHFSSVKVPTFPDVTFINILTPGTSKGKALEALAAHLEIPLEAVMAVGDGHNDISLLATAGLGIAMGNAQEELKQVADRVTLHVEEHGLAAAVAEFLL